MLVIWPEKSPNLSDAGLGVSYRSSSVTFLTISHLQDYVCHLQARRDFQEKLCWKMDHYPPLSNDAGSPCSPAASHTAFERRHSEQLQTLLIAASARATRVCSSHYCTASTTIYPSQRSNVKSKWEAWLGVTVRTDYLVVWRLYRFIHPS